MKPVGVSILTNSNRGRYAVSCIESFLANCYYRPLVFGIFSNGSTDNTIDQLRLLKQLMPNAYGIEWRVQSIPTDIGCARGTNAAHDMVKDTEYAIHLESDFGHMTEAESGVDKLWLHDAVRFMDTGVCDYLYLRRMRSESEMMQHWWSQWKPQVTEISGPYLNCPPFWWSNNPTLRRVKALYDCKTLPLRVELDGAKGQEGWSQPELNAPRPTKPWIYRWGMFTHEPVPLPSKSGCGRHGPYGLSTCKYGFHTPDALFCTLCDQRIVFTELNRHEQRYRNKLGA